MSCRHGYVCRCDREHALTLLLYLWETCCVSSHIRCVSVLMCERTHSDVFGENTTLIASLLKVFTINPDQIQRQNVFFCYFWHQVWAGNLMNFRTWGAHEGVVCSCSIVLWVSTPARTCDRSHLKIQNSQKWRASSVKDLCTFCSSPYTVTFSLLSSCYRY